MNDFLPTSAASPTSTPTPPATTATPNAPNVPGGASGGSGSGSGPASQASPPVLPNLTAPIVPPPAPSQPSLSSPMSSSQEPDLRSASLYLNRELSWLEFNARVLAEAENESVPLLERLKFHAIVSSNLDEFFMVRVAGLKTQQTGEVGEIPPDGMTVSEQLSAIAARVHDLVNQQSNSLTVQLLPKLAEQGIVLVKPESLPNDALANLDERFHNEVFPILTPIAIDPGHPFPHVRNKSLNLGVMFMREGELEAGFGVVQVPMMLPRLLEVSGVKSKDGSTAKHAFVLLEALIARHVGTIFPAFA